MTRIPCRATNAIAMKRRHHWILSLPLFAVLSGCSGEGKEAPAAPAAPAAPTAEVLARLASADAKDGTADKVVEKCAGCNLGKPGKAEKSLKVGEYEMRFCSDNCLQAFSRDPNGEILKKLAR
ncbi:MAG: hypothetical protein Fur0037_06960 [Planctomycetota bacterium]